MSPTYHCIRRLNLDGVVRAVCGPIGISQATADIYHARVATLDSFGGQKTGTMTMRNGRIAIVEDTPEHQAATRALVECGAKLADGQYRDNCCNSGCRSAANHAQAFFRGRGTVL